MKNIIILFILLCSLVSCDSSIVYSKYFSIEDEWDKDLPIEFSFQTKDTVRSKNIFIMLRNNENYPYSNIFLITKMQMPNHKIVVDTLEYEMANPDGSWMGYGLGSNKESKLWYKENVTFPTSGEYIFSVSQAMRNVGNTEGVNKLRGINEIGLQIENNIQK